VSGSTQPRRQATAANDWGERKRRAAARAEHNGRCDLCGAAKGERGSCGAVLKSALHYDHSHTSGEHRGFICGRANRVLWPWVTAAWLRQAADYLERATS
jgi:hypothetical protein